MNGGRNLVGLRPPFIFTSTSFLRQTIFQSPENDFPFCGKRFSG